MFARTSGIAILVMALSVLDLEAGGGTKDEAAAATATSREQIPTLPAKILKEKTPTLPAKILTEQIPTLPAKELPREKILTPPAKDKDPEISKGVRNTEKQFIYHQSSGKLTLGDMLVGVGYSGKGGGKNNPKKEMEKNVGPIPQGLYKIGKAREWRGMANVTDLMPEGHNALGRTEFLIHGDSKKNPGDASEGCIVLSPEIRRRISESSITKLVVVKD